MKLQNKAFEFLSSRQSRISTTRRSLEFSIHSRKHLGSLGISTHSRRFHIRANFDSSNDNRNVVKAFVESLAGNRTIILQNESFDKSNDVLENWGFIYCGGSKSIDDSFHELSPRDQVDLNSENLKR